MRRSRDLLFNTDTQKLELLLTPLNKLGVTVEGCELAEATYLAWMDCRTLGLADPVRFFEDAGVGLSDGRDFGSPGFVRLNFGCSRRTLEEGLRRIRAAVEAGES